jgi:hypothetical protein
MNVLKLMLVAAPLAAFAQAQEAATPPEPAPAAVAAAPAPPAPPLPPAPPAAASPPTAASSPERRSDPAHAALAAAPRWSIGAGVGFGGWIVLGSSSPSLFLPAATASIERAVGARTWLSLGLAGSLDQERTEIEPEAITYPVQRNLGQVSVIAGVRREVSDPRSAVAVSLTALGEGGVLRRTMEAEAYPGTDLRSWVAGVSGGLVLERALTAGLLVRLSTPAVGLRYGRTRDEKVSGAAAVTTGLSLQVRLAPSLELRLAF